MRAVHPAALFHFHGGRARVHSPWLQVVRRNGSKAEHRTFAYVHSRCHTGSRAHPSVRAYLCGATHDFDDPGFPLLAYSTEVAAKDPYLRPAFPLRQRIARLAWNICWAIFYRLSPRPVHGWRAMLLRLFGAKMGPNCHFYPTSRVWAPWNLMCADQVTAGDGVEIYNPAPVRLRSHAILSQNS